MVRSQVALVLFALSGCGSSDGEGAAGASASPPSTTSATDEATENPAVDPAGAEGTTTAAPGTAAEDETAPPAGPIAHHAAAIDSEGWAERERRTFVFQGAARGNVSGIAIARGGTHVAIGSDTGFVTLLDAASGEVRASERIARSNFVRFDLEIVGDVALVGWEDPSDASGVEIWRWRGGTRIDVDQTNHLDVGGVRVAMSPRGDRFAVGSYDALHVGSMGNGRVTTRVARERDGQLSWPHANALVETVFRRAGERGLVRVYDPRTLAEVWSAPFDALAIVQPAGDRVVLLDGTDVVVRALPGGEERARIAHGVARANRVVVSREGDRVVVSSDALSAMILLGDGARTEIAAGRALWVSPRNVLVETDDGAVRRWVIDRARLGAHAAPPRVSSDDDYGVANLVEVDPTGTLVSARGDHVEIVPPSGTRHVFAHGGEHSVWSVVPDPARSGLALGGRFGVQGWRATGVHDTQCRGARTSMTVDWQAGVIVSDGACDLATGALPRDAERPYAVSDDGRFVVETSGGFVERSTSRRVQLEGQSELYCDFPDACGGTAFIAPRGTAVVLETFNADEDTLVVHEAAEGRRLGALPYGAAFAFAPDGSWLTYAHTRALHVLDLVGDDHATRTLVPGSEDDEELTQSTVVLAISPDGGSIAWTPENGHRVHVVSVVDGHDTSDLTVGARVLELRWSASGSQLGVRTEREIRIYDVGNDTPARTLRAARGTLAIACSERVLYWIRDASAGGLEAVDLGACEGGELPLLTRGESQLVWIDEGTVRLRRLDDGSELVFRTLHEDAARRHHLAHDADGHWWTDEPATEASPVPTWVRHGDGRGGETTPLDPAMRRDDLLQRFFTAR